MKLLPSDRTRATQRKYQEDIEADRLIGLTNEPAIVEHEYWRLIVNRYPYDERWCTSMLLVYKGGYYTDEITDEAILELHKLKEKYLQVFDKIEENGSVLSSVPGIPHIHLLQGLK